MRAVMQSWRRPSRAHGRTEPLERARACLSVCLSVLMAGGESLRSQLLAHLNSLARLNTALLETGPEEAVKEGVSPPDSLASLWRLARFSFSL